MTPTFLYPIFGLETITMCPGCGWGTKLREHNFVVVPRFTTRDKERGNLQTRLRLPYTVLMKIRGKVKSLDYQ